MRQHELIETLWNVNVPQVVSVVVLKRINRNIVECKFLDAHHCAWKTILN